MEKSPKDNLPIILFETEQEWGDWLEKNIAEPGVWVKIAKKNSVLLSVSYQQALDVAICYGWIDGLKMRYDEKVYIQRFTPRKPKSNWSKINKAKAEQFIKEGKMKPAGLATIENAKKAGSWNNAYDTQKNIKIPVDFLTELKKKPEALEFFHSLTGVNRYAILYRIQISRTPEKRKEKMDKFVEMLLKKEKIYE